MIQNLTCNLVCGSTKIASSPRNRPLETSEIKLFKIKISAYLEVVPNLRQLLNPNEMSRAERFYFERDKNRFIICRALLKLILTEETKQDILNINIEAGINKKPYLTSHPQLFFNVSHSGDYAIIAIDNQPIGVDVEFIDAHQNVVEIMPEVFKNPEIDAVLNANDKNYTFYKFWTRKEAIAKASGKGIDTHFLRIPALEGSHTIKTAWVSGIENLQVLSFDLDEHYIAAIAFQRSEPYANHWAFHPIPSIK